MGDFPHVGFDPAPGDPWEVERLVGTFRSAATALEEMSALLHGAASLWRSGRSLARWRLIDRREQWRSLPPGAIAAEDRAPWDARDAEDVDLVSAREVAWHAELTRADLRLLVQACAVLPVGLLGLAGLLSTLLVPSGDGAAAAVAVLAPAGVATGGWLWLWGQWFAELGARQRELDLRLVERQALRARHEVTHGAPATEVVALPAWARPLAAAILLGLAALLVVRVALASALALAISVAVLGILALLLGGSWARRRRRARSPHLVPLVARDDRGPRGGAWEPVSVEDSGDAVRLTGVQGSLTVQPLARRPVLVGGPAATALITRDDVVVVTALP